MLQVRVYRDLEQRVSSDSAEKWSNCGYEGRANKICWYIRCSGKQRESSQNSKVFDWTTGSMELAFIEMGKETGLGRTPRVWFLSFSFVLRLWFRTS